MILLLLLHLHHAELCCSCMLESEALGSKRPPTCSEPHREDHCHGEEPYGAETDMQKLEQTEESIER